MKQRERITREDMGYEEPVGDTKLTPRPYTGFKSDPNNKGPAQVGNAQTVGEQTHGATTPSPKQN